MFPFTPFPSIESFANVVRTMRRVPIGERAPVIHYGSKIKLHGTNAGIRISGCQVQAQSRNRDITPDQDNCGFAAWVEETREFWSKWDHPGTSDAVIFGEWAGPGVQGGAQAEAVSKLDRKHFFVFAIYEPAADVYWTDPLAIGVMLGRIGDLPIRVLPWIDQGPVDFNAGASLEQFAAAISNGAELIGEHDLYIAKEFGIAGTGEGLVFMPTDRAPGSEFAAATFKVKAEAHRVRKTKAAASAGFQLPDSIAELAASFVTPARCEQALREIGGVAERPRMGEFLKWIGGDVKKESAGELEAAGSDWKKVSGIVSKHAAAWFLARCEEVRDVAA